MAFWMSVLLAACCLGLLCWLLLSPGRHQPNASAPAEMRAYAWCWPWVVALAELSRPFLPWRLREAWSRRATLAGLASDWLPEYLTAIQLGGGSVVWLISTMLILQTDAPLVQAVWLGMGVGVLAGAWPWLWLGARCRKRQQALHRELPFFLDLLTLCVEAGQSLQGALQQVSLHAPQGPLTQELLRVQAQLRTGMSRVEAFEALAQRTGLPALRQFSMTLRQAEQFGMSLGPILRAQAAQQRDERFLHAEKLAMEAPVKMLFPMVLCIFPCTFLIIGFPLLAGLMEVG